MKSLSLVFPIARKISLALVCRRKNGKWNETIVFSSAHELVKAVSLNHLDYRKSYESLVCRDKSLFLNALTTSGGITMAFFHFSSRCRVIFCWLFVLFIHKRVPLELKSLSKTVIVLFTLVDY